MDIGHVLSHQKILVYIFNLKRITNAILFSTTTENVEHYSVFASQPKSITKLLTGSFQYSCGAG